MNKPTNINTTEDKSQIVHHAGGLIENIIFQIPCQHHLKKRI